MANGRYSLVDVERLRDSLVEDAEDTPLPAPPTLPSRAPTWWGELRPASRIATVVAAALVGTGGCSGLATGTTALIGALKPDLGRVERRLDSIEGKLDQWRDEQLALKARVVSAEQRVVELTSHQRAAEEVIKSQAKQLRDE